MIAIGDELVSGQRLDTNSRWISEQLGYLGIQTIRHTTVGDDLATNVEAMQSAAQRADIVVCTGGLGPTLDDLTRQAMADAFQRPLILDAVVLERIQQMFANRNRAMPERNEIQAMFPSGSHVINNPHGSAPGIDLDVEYQGSKCRLFALPGVPAELKQMWTESLVPTLEHMLGGAAGPLRYFAIKLFGIGESDVEVHLPDLIERSRQPTVGITVSRATITLRIAGRAHTEEQFQQLIQPTVQQIEGKLGELIFGSGDDELEHAVSRQLSNHGLRMASVEVGAASWIGDWMLAAADSNSQSTGAMYLGGLVFPSLQQAATWLGAADNQLESTDDEVWKAVATQAHQRFSADITLVVGVYPSSNQAANATAPFEPVIAIVHQDQIYVTRLRMGGHPDVLGPRIAKTGLDLVRKLLKSLS